MAESGEAVLHDGSRIAVTVQGEGPALLLPVRLEPYGTVEAETMRKWGGDPDVGPALVRGLSGSNRVIAADYEGHRMAHPAADTLTPDNLAADLLAIADAAGADAFGYYGYSWLALSGLQLALRTDRLRALAMGGFPPLDGPYRSMLAVTRAAHAMSSSRPTRAVFRSPTPNRGTGTPSPSRRPRRKHASSSRCMKRSRGSTTSPPKSRLNCRGSPLPVPKTRLTTAPNGAESECGSVNPWPNTRRPSSPLAGTCRSFPGWTTSAQCTAQWCCPF